MGTISLENTDRLFWLGRYSERVYTTIKLFIISYDNMIDQDKNSYIDFCSSLDIPNIYNDCEEFRARYCFDIYDPNSICSNLYRAYDNAVILREEIGSESLAYIQMAIYEIIKARESDTPLIELQQLLDHILAFWGIYDDIIEDEAVRSFIKAGKRTERLDLYIRLKADKPHIERELNRLKGRLKKTTLSYNPAYIEEFEELLKSDDLDYKRMLFLIESLYC